MILWYSVDTVRRLRWRVASRHFRLDRAIAAANRRSNEGGTGYGFAYAVPTGRIVAEFENGVQTFPLIVTAGEDAR
jgi:hypothetical protein